ncbi:MAG: hypothetical protein LAT54_05460 [Cryomorphaceae bacterium]|nr:hypothetical protein [Cryomorphaceae bacterium]
MEKIKLPIILTTIYLFLFVVISTFDALLALTFLLVSLSPIPIIWMVYRVLRDGTPSPHTFEERFYEDYEYERLR